MKISYIQKRPCTAEKVGWNLLPPLSSILSNSVHEYVFLYFITLLYEYVLLFFITLLYDYHHDCYNFFNFKPIFPILDQDGPDLVRLSQSFKTNLEQQNNKQSVQPWVGIKKHINLSCVKLLRLGTSKFHQNSSLDLYSIKAITIYHIIDI